MQETVLRVEGQREKFVQKKRARVEVCRGLFPQRKQGKNFGPGELKWVTDKGGVWANSEEMPLKTGLLSRQGQPGKAQM